MKHILQNDTISLKPNKQRKNLDFSNPTIATRASEKWFSMCSGKGKIVSSLCIVTLQPTWKWELILKPISDEKWNQSHNGASTRLSMETHRSCSWKEKNLIFGLCACWDYQNLLRTTTLITHQIVSRRKTLLHFTKLPDCRLTNGFDCGYGELTPKCFLLRCRWKRREVELEQTMVQASWDLCFASPHGYHPLPAINQVRTKVNPPRDMSLPPTDVPPPPTDMPPPLMCHAPTDTPQYMVMAAAKYHGPWGQISSFYCPLSFPALFCQYTEIQ